MWALILLACHGHGDAAPRLAVVAAPPDQVAADQPLALSFTVSDRDTPVGKLVIEVTGLAPASPPQVEADGSFAVSVVPAVGDQTMTVTATDPDGNEGHASLSFEAIDGDVDGDGHVATSLGGDDCDDGNAEVAPGKAETCDGLDDDCDGTADEDPVDGATWFPDADGDHFGSDAGAFQACDPPPDAVDRAGDCDDGNAFVRPFLTVLGTPGCEGLGAAFAWTGEAADDRAGDNVRDAGDLDGDGRSEVLVAAPGVAAGAGAVYVVGATAPGTADLSGAIAKITGENAEDAAGWDAFGPGDLDGDGAGDLLVGAAGWDGAAGGEGAAYVLLGPFAGEVPLATAYARLSGVGAGATAGDVSAGDFDGDGVTELAIGAKAADSGGIDAGAVDVVPLPPAGDAAADDLATSRFLGDRPGVFAGDPIPVGDLDGDGLDDLAIATQDDDTYGPSCGALYVVLSPLPPGDTTLDQADSRWVGNPGSIATHSADGAGDLDDDGRADVVIGAPYDDPNGSKSGAAYVLFGPGPAGTASLPAIADAVLLGAIPGIRAGFSVSHLFDMNQDGRADLAIGAKFDDTVGVNAGSVYVVPGPFAGASDLGTAGVELLGEATRDLAGDVGAVPDLDGDGIPDLLVGARYADIGGADSGTAYLVFGATF